MVIKGGDSVSNQQQPIKDAFISSIPVLLGYGILGMTYGVLMAQAGFGVAFTTLTSLFLFAGAAQYLLIPLLVSNTAILTVFLLVLSVNARHLFYGLSMLTPYKGLGLIRPYLIFGLTDETFAILSSKQAGSFETNKTYMLSVTLLNHIYWVSASLIGGLLASLRSVSLQHLAFILAAMFVVMFLDRLSSKTSRMSALLGLITGLVSLIVFGKDSFLLVSLPVVILISLISKRGGRAHA